MSRKFDFSEGNQGFLTGLKSCGGGLFQREKRAFVDILRGKKATPSGS
jgi:hypothetical protein